MAGGLVVFVGPTGGIRETEGIGGDGANITLTNTTSGAVLDTDVAVYWASLRQDGGPIDAPVITPSKWRNTRWPAKLSGSEKWRR